MKQSNIGTEVEMKTGMKEMYCARCKENKILKEAYQLCPVCGCTLLPRKEVKEEEIEMSETDIMWGKAKSAYTTLYTLQEEDKKFFQEKIIPFFQSLLGRSENERNCGEEVAQDSSGDSFNQGTGEERVPGSKESIQGDPNKKDKTPGEELGKAVKETFGTRTENSSEPEASSTEETDLRGDEVPETQAPSSSESEEGIETTGQGNGEGAEFKSSNGDNE